MSSDTHTQNSRVNENYWSSQRIAIYALLSALALLLSFVEFPIFPAAPFLKYNPSGIIVLLAGFAYGPLAAFIVALISSAPHIFTNPIGGLIGLLCIAAFALPAATIYKKNRTKRGAFIGLIIGALAFILTAIVLNLLFTPLYTATSVSQVAAMIIPILLPFNALKAVINIVVTVLCYKPVTSLLKAFAQSRKNERRI
ncbi:ECF transporter S component [Alloscardovia venturai]|uniref:Riboflavin transporter n=1 Tax=Alloscardovia venturai TaxID=1769421 RepID=A0ABW2Y6Q2_9BIFI